MELGTNCNLQEQEPLVWKRWRSIFKGSGSRMTFLKQRLHNRWASAFGDVTAVTNHYGRLNKLPANRNFCKKEHCNCRTRQVRQLISFYKCKRENDVDDKILRYRETFLNSKKNTRIGYVFRREIDKSQYKRPSLTQTALYDKSMLAVRIVYNKVSLFTVNTTCNWFHTTLLLTQPSLYSVSYFNGQQSLALLLKFHLS